MKCDSDFPRRRACCTAVGLACLLLSAAPAAADSPASWTPADALLFIGTPSYDALTERWQRTLFHQLFADEALRSFTDGLSTEFDESWTQAAQALGVKVEQLHVKPSGPAALIVGAPQDQGSRIPPPVAFVADWGARSPQVRELFDSILAHAVESGAQTEVGSFEGVPYVTLRRGQPAPASTGPAPSPARGAASMDTPGVQTRTGPPWLSSPVFFATTGTVSIITTSDALLREILQGVAGRLANPLSQQDSFNALAEHCGSAGQVQLYIDHSKLVDLAPNDVNSKLDQLGLDGYGPLVASVALNPDNGIGLEVRGYVPTQGERRGLARHIADHLANKPLSVGHALSASTILCGWLNLDFSRIIDTVYEVIKQTDPQRAETYKAGLTIDLGPDQVIDVARIFNSLSMPLLLQASMEPPYDRENVAILLSINHHSAEGVGQLFTLLSNYCTQRKVLERTIYDVLFPPIGASMVLTDDRFAVGNTPGIDRLVNAEGKPPGSTLATDPQFLRATARAPKEACDVFYLDLRKLLTAALALHQAALADPAAQTPNFSWDMTAVLRDKLKDLPFTKLEQPQRLLRYTPSLLCAVAARPAGFELYMNLADPVGAD